MKPASWACCDGAAAALLIAAAATLAAAASPSVAAAAASPSVAGAAAVEPAGAAVIASPQADAPPPDDPRWREVPLAHAQPADVAWYRVRFDAAAAADGFWMLYLPYFYGGGRIWLNGQPVAAVTENSAALRVRWERPLLLPLPVAALRPRGNLLLVRAVADAAGGGTLLPRLVLGPQTALQPRFDRRLFLVRTVPVITVATGSVVGLLVLLIWWRRRDEVLYGLFGQATLLWALRTTTFVFDTMPATWWDGWRLMYFATTGGFVIVMALFALELAGWSRRTITRALLGYWALGPAAYLLGSENAASRWWVAGLMPVGLGLAGVAIAAAWRQRSAATVSIAAAVLVAVAAGLHDYGVAWRSPWVEALLPEWSQHRIFLLHHAANLLLVVMGTLQAMRFVRTLGAVEAANRTLEARVQQREREVVASYDRIAALQREQAATDERQRIMRDLHDGLGSQLFTSLSRAERGVLDAVSMADTLRGAIDQMRLAIEALASDDRDFRTAFGNFHFRWESRLRDAGVASDWQIELPDAVLAIAPHDALQILHITQEALTNVLKHAQARRVQVRLVLGGGVLALDVVDDGRGGGGVGNVGVAGEAGAVAAGGATAGGHRGRGRHNMQSRAQRLGGTLDISLTAGVGTRVGLRVPLVPLVDAASVSTVSGSV